MNINWTFLEQNMLYIAGLAIALWLIWLLMWLRLHLKTNKLKQENTKLEQQIQQDQIELTLNKQRLSDLSATYNKIEAEKNTWITTAQSLERDFSAFKAASQTKEENLNEKITYLEKIKEDLSLKFKAISAEIIKAQHETFSSEQKNTLSAVINPFAEQLKAFKAEVIATREEGIKNKSNLDAQLNNLVAMNLTLSHDAQNLAEALKGGKKTQGNWGECQLNRILEISGLRKGIDYETQESFISEEKKLYRPDVIVHLPENRDIIIDSKVSLTDYLDSIDSKDDMQREKSLQKNALAIKAHIDELSLKEYQKLLKDRTLNYVIMFIPVESAYIAALEYDNFIYDYAYKKNVILATPLSLLPTLRTIENLWRIDNQNHNVQKIAELGGKIHDKLAAFVDDMKAIERGINQTSNAYNSAISKLSGRGGALSQAEKMKALGAQTNKTINLALNDNDLSLPNESTNEELSYITQVIGDTDA